MLSYDVMCIYESFAGFEKLAMLSSLENLDLSSNNFNNSILSTLGGLASLKSLNLNFTGLMGTIRADGEFKLMPSQCQHTVGS